MNGKNNIENKEKQYDFDIILETLLKSNKKEFTKIKSYLLKEVFYNEEKEEEEDEEKKENWIVNKLIKKFIIKKGKLKLNNHNNNNKINYVNRIKADLYDNLDDIFVFNKKENYNEFGESIMSKMALNFKSYLVFLHLNEKRKDDEDDEEKEEEENDNFIFWTNIFVFIKVLDNCRLYTQKVHEIILKIFSNYNLELEIQLFFTLLFILNMLFSFNSTQFTFILNSHYIKNKNIKNLK